MPKMTLKGIIHTVENPGVVGEKNTPKQLIYLKVPPYTDEFGEVRGFEKIWQISIMGDSVKKFNIDASFETKKAILEVYVDTNYIAAVAASATQTARSEMYIVNLNLASIEIK